MIRVEVNTIGAIILAVIVALLVAPNARGGEGQHRALTQCAVYDTRSNVAAWVRGSSVQVARYVDWGEEGWWVRDQSRIPQRLIPARVRRIVFAWPVVPHQGWRVRCSHRRFVVSVRRAVAVCSAQVRRGDAYTEEMFDQ